MAYFHGVRITESPTPLQVPSAVDSALPVAIGVAPVHRLENPAIAVNNPALLFNFSEGVADMGYMDPQHWKKFPLSMMMYSQFRVHLVSPLVLINVWNPLEDAVEVAEPGLPVINGIATVDDPMAMISGVIVHNANTGDPDYVRGVDYALRYDGDKLLIELKADGDIPVGTTALSITYKQATVDNIIQNDIIGGVDPNTNQRTGIELVDEVFQVMRKIPSFLLTPGWSHVPEIGALLAGKAEHLEGEFSCVALVDLPTTGQYSNYRNLPKWKNDNSYISPYMFADWPCTKIGDQVFLASVRMAGMYGEIDNQNGGLPYEQASNKLLSMTDLCDEDGNVIPMMSVTQANYLNENGIGTFINMDGWRAWGTETTAFPGNTDIKDFERGVRRMFSFVQNVVNRTMWQNVDKPIRRLLIDTILLTGNEYINTLRSRGAVIGGRVEFLQADNSNQDIMSGKLFFSVFLTPPNAAKELEFNFSYDPDYLATLFD
jgi:phage tail sheath protein FI